MLICDIHQEPSGSFTREKRILLQIGLKKTSTSNQFSALLRQTEPCFIGQHGYSKYLSVPSVYTCMDSKNQTLSVSVPKSAHCQRQHIRIQFTKPKVRFIEARGGRRFPCRIGHEVRNQLCNTTYLPPPEGAGEFMACTMSVVRASNKLVMNSTFFPSEQPGTNQRQKHTKITLRN